MYVGTLIASRFLLVRELTRINLEGDSSKRASFREGPPNAWLLRESDNPYVSSFVILFTRSAAPVVGSRERCYAVSHWPWCCLALRLFATMTWLN